MYQQGRGGSGIDAGIGKGEAQVLTPHRPAQQQRIQSPYGRGAASQKPIKLPNVSNRKTFIGHTKYFENQMNDIRKFKAENLNSLSSGDAETLNQLAEKISKYDFDANNSEQVAKEYERIAGKYTGKNYDRLEPQSQQYLADVADPNKNQDFHLVEEQKVQEKFFPTEFYGNVMSKLVPPQVQQYVGEAKGGLIPTEKIKDYTIREASQGVATALREDPKYFSYLDNQIKTLPKEEVTRLEEIGKKYQPYSTNPALIGLGAEEYTGMKPTDVIRNIKNESESGQGKSLAKDVKNAEIDNPLIEVVGSYGKNLTNLTPEQKEQSYSEIGEIKRHFAFPEDMKNFVSVVQSPTGNFKKPVSIDAKVAASYKHNESGNPELSKAKASHIDNMFVNEYKVALSPSGNHKIYVLGNIPVNINTKGDTTTESEKGTDQFMTVADNVMLNKLAVYKGYSNKDGKTAGEQLYEDLVKSAKDAVSKKQSTTIPPTKDNKGGIDLNKYGAIKR